MRYPEVRVEHRSGMMPGGIQLTPLNGTTSGPTLFGPIIRWVYLVKKSKCSSKSGPIKPLVPLPTVPISGVQCISIFKTNYDGWENNFLVILLFLLSNFCSMHFLKIQYFPLIYKLQLFLGCPNVNH